ncbi:pilus assembly protein PilM [Tissierella praeacuta]|uniref:pilus assembly protein PilM n=1 Tax=Tissierella praeacuta TaxID=43131 RepID=UPI0033425ABE
MRLPSIPRKALSIDFGSKEIKVIEGKYSKNNIQIFKAITIPIESYFYKNGEILNKDVLSTLIIDALKDNKISTDSVYAIINSSNIITREITIPKVSKDEIDSIIKYQLDDFFPVSPEEYIINHLIIGNRIEDEVEKINILLIGIPKDMIESHFELIKNIGLKPQVLDYQSNSMAKLLGFNERVNGLYNTRDLVLASIDIGYNSSKLAIIKNGNIEVSRIIDIGAELLYEDLGEFFDCSLNEMEQKIEEIEDISIYKEEYTEYYRLVNIVKNIFINLMEKIEMIFRYYITRDSSNIINFIVLEGGLSNINGVDNLFSNYFNIPAIKLLSLDKIKWDGDLSKFSNAIGGLIRFDKV